MRVLRIQGALLHMTEFLIYVQGLYLWQVVYTTLVSKNIKRHYCTEVYKFLYFLSRGLTYNLKICNIREYYLAINSCNLFLFILTSKIIILNNGFLNNDNINLCNIFYFSDKIFNEDDIQRL